MSTIFQSQRKDITGTGLTQIKSYTEGDAELLLDAITFDNEKDYTDVITVTFDIAGGDASLFTLESTSTVAPIVATDADTRTITSQYVKSNYTQNVHADVASTLANLKLTFNNTDVSASYVITVTLSDGHSSTQGTITITGNAVTDATNIVQNLTIDEDDALWDFTTGEGGGVIPAISDLDEAGKTYRVTITSPAASAILHCESVYAVGVDTFVPVIVLEGTQTQINDAINATTSTLYVMSGPDVSDPFTITWLQEVISGATGAPYVQENGQFNFTVTNANAADTAVANFNYTEDTLTAVPFNIATINDTRTRTTGLAEVDNYHATMTLSNPASGIINSVTGGWANEGGGVFTVSAENVGSSMQGILDTVRFLPAADYISSSDTATLTLTRGHQKGDPTWYISPNTNEQTLIDAAVITITNIASHNEFAIAGSQTYVEDTVTAWDVGSITDLAADKNYTMTLTFSDVNAIDSIAGWTPGVAGVWSYSGTGGPCNAALASVAATPGTDYTGAFTFTYQQQQTTDSINQGTSSAVTVTNSTSHNEYSISVTSNINEDTVTNLNFGSITDLALSKNYTITLVLSDVTKGTINAPWVVGAPGTYTLSGTKAYLNGQLSVVPFAPASDIDTGTITISYQQQQTTDSINQGNTAVAATLTFVGVIDATNIIQTGLVIDEDEYQWTFSTDPQIADQAGGGSGKTYKVTLAPSPPIPPGFLTNDVYDLSCTSSYITSATYGSTITMEGTQSQLNNVLNGSDGSLRLDKTTADDQTDFVINYTQEVLVGGVGTAVDYIQETGSFTFVVTPDVDAGYTVNTGPYVWNAGAASLLGTIGVVTDTRGDQFDAATILYRATIQTDTPVTNTDGALSSAGTGGTSVWDSVDTLTIEGTKTQVNSHLATITWTGAGTFSNAFTMNTELFRNINSAGWITHKSVTNILMDSGNGASGKDTAWRYDEDEATLLNDVTKLT